MKAEDTVMTFMEQSNEMKTAKVLPGCLVRKQAEISFKAGIKEVVEWLLSEGGFPWDMDEYPERIKLWQAKLKEWGLTPH